MKTKGKITLWSILSGVMLVLAIACIVGTFVAERYVSIINSFFNLDNYKIVGKTDPDTDTKYYKSAFLDENGEPIYLYCASGNGGSPYTFDGATYVVGIKLERK